MFMKKAKLILEFIKAVITFVLGYIGGNNADSISSFLGF